MKASQRNRLRAATPSNIRTNSGGENPPGHTATWRDHLRYRTDEVLSRGTLGVILWLAALTFGFILITALVLTGLNRRFNGETESGLIEAAWQSLLRVIDPGTMSGDRGWAVRLIALVVTIAGIFLASALIGIIATGLDQKIEQLRKGRSFVVETGHTAILGWSPRLHTLVSELTIANENHRGLAIVVLADRDKTEMEDDIRSRVPDLRGSKLVCRTGDPSSPSDLGIVNIDAARAVVVLGEDGSAGDAEAVKALLAVGSRRDTIGHVPVVTEISDEGTARALDLAFGDDVLAVRSTDVVARVTAQSCRQAGLSFVVQELLNFDGDEIYLQEAPELVGHTFGEALLAYERSALIGRRAADGSVEICPPMTTVFGPGDAVIAISEDDDTVTFAGFADRPAIDGIGLAAAPPVHEQMLIVGWNHLGPRVLHELDQFVASGSVAHVVVDPRLVAERADLVSGLVNFDADVTFTSDEGELIQKLASEHEYTSVIILSYRNGPTAAEADARSLLALLLLDRALADGAHDAKPRIVVELLDAKDVDLARVSGADDFVVSDALASYMMAQLAEHPERSEIFRQLYTARGSSLFMEVAAPYTAAGEVTFADVVATTAASGACAIGWRRMLADGEAEVVVNPPKSAAVTFGPDDHIVVIG